MFTCPSAVTAMLIALQTAGGEPVTIATEGANYAPYIIFDGSGGIEGFDKDIADEVCLRASLDCDWEFARFDELIPGVASGKYDLALGGIAVTQERLELVDFSLPYNEPSDLSVYLGKQSAPPPEAAVIGVQAGTIYETRMRQLERPYKTYATLETLTAAVIAGEVDLMLAGLPPGDEAALSEKEGLVTKGSESIPDLGTAMVICKGNTELKDRVDTALKAMMADGTLDEISDRWF